MLTRDTPGDQGLPRPLAAGRRRPSRRPATDVRRVVIADDDSMFRLGLRESLAALLPHATFAEVASQAALESALAAEPPPLVLIDPAVPGSRGYLSLLPLLARYRETRFVAVSSVDAPVVGRRALVLGLAGYVSKRATPERIAQVVARALRQRTAARLPPAERSLIEGMRRLTPAELKIFSLLPDNPSHRHLMRALDIALPTVKTHMSRILQKLGLRNRTEAAIVAKRASVLSAPSLCIERPGAAGAARVSRSPAG